MKKYISKVIFILFLIFPIMSFSNKLERLSYRNGIITLKFSDRIPKYTESFDHNTPDLRLHLENVEKSKNIEQVISISDKYLLDIVSEQFDNSSEVVIYMQTGTTYNISKSGRELKIRFKEASSLPKRDFTIILDAGHGGKDSGAIGNGYKEKDLALAVVLKLYNNLKRDYNVILTRSTDVFIPLNTRAEIGNNAKADLFVSVHLNSSTNRSANGAEVFYFSKNPTAYASQIAKYENSFDVEGTRAIEASQFLIEDILYNLNQRVSANVANTVLDAIVDNIPIERRKVAGANFAVLRGSVSPSILIELGFISNYNDVINYTSESGQIKVANVIADAIRKHY